MTDIYAHPHTIIRPKISLRVKPKPLISDVDLVPTCGSVLSSLPSEAKYDSLKVKNMISQTGLDLLDLTNFLFAELKSQIYPVMTASMGSLLQPLSDEIYFSLITGDVQLTKTTCILFLIWIHLFVHQRTVAFMTADSTELREQVMGSCQTFNQNISKLITTYLKIKNFPQDAQSDLTQYFCLSGVPYKQFSLDQEAPGCFPVFIQEKTNLENLLRLYNQKVARYQSNLSIVIDEIDDLYSLPWEEFDINGLTEKSVSRGNVLKILYDLAHQNQIKLFGITATPGVLLQSKHLIPSCMVKVQTDGFPGCQYIGSINHPQVTQTVVDSLDDESILDLLQTIEEQPHHTINLSQTNLGRPGTYYLQKLIAINTHQKIDDQVYLANLIHDRFPSIFSVFAFNAETSSISLNQFLEHCPPDQTVVIIGRGRMRRGVRIKPTSHTRVAQGYALSGITHYIIKVSESDPNVETIQQSMRQYGIYPTDFHQTIYSTKTGLKTILDAESLNHQLKSPHHLIKGYISLEDLTIDQPLALVSKKKNALVCHKEVYQTNGEYEITSQDPRDLLDPDHPYLVLGTDKSFYLDVFKTCLPKGKLAKLDPQTTLTELHNQTKLQNELRRLISDQCQKLYTHGGDKIQMGYRDNRWSELIRASIFPKDTTESHWQVNILVGPPDSKLNHLPITVFEDPWDQRRLICNCDDTNYIYQLANQQWVQVIRRSCETEEAHYLYKPYELTTSEHGSRLQEELLSELGEVGQAIKASLSSKSLKLDPGHAFVITPDQYRNYVNVSAANSATKQKLSICIGTYANLLVFKNAMKTQIPGINILSLACLLKHVGYR